MHLTTKLLILLTGMGCCLNAQTTYQPLPGNSTWRYLGLFCDDNSEAEQVRAVGEFTDSAGVQIIQDVCRDGSIISNNYGRYFQSEDYSKLYYHNEFNDTDYLIMDLNLEVGDTFDMYYWRLLGEYRGGGPVVTDVSFDTIGRKVVTFDYTPGAGCSGIDPAIIGSFEFIEGIGPTRGFFNGSIISAAARLFCVMDDKFTPVYQDDELLASANVDPSLPNSRYTCELYCPTSTRDLAHPFPRPLTNPLRPGQELNFGDLRGELRVFASDGRVLKRLDVTSPVVNTDFLANFRGMAVLRLFSDEGRVYVSRIIVQ